MKIASLVLGLVALLGFSGCATTGGTPAAPTLQVVSQIVTPVIQGAVPLVLEKNPGYADAVDVLAGSLTVALGDGDLTPAVIGGTIALINTKAKLGLDPSVQTLLSVAISTTITVYKQHYGLSVAKATDPGVQLLLKQISEALHNGVEIWRASHAAAVAAPVL